MQILMSNLIIKHSKTKETQRKAEDEEHIKIIC